MLRTTQGIESKVETLQQDVRVLIESTAETEPRVNAPAVVKSALWRMAPPAAWILGAGFYFDAMEMNGTLILLTYVSGALAVVMGPRGAEMVQQGARLAGA